MSGVGEVVLKRAKNEGARNAAARQLPLLVVDVQQGFLNDYTRHIPCRIAQHIERDRPQPVLFTRFVNRAGSSYHRFLDWHACDGPPETDLAEELAVYAREERIFTKPGLAGISDELRTHLPETQPGLVGVDTDRCVLKIELDVFDLGIEPLIFVDAGHLAATPVQESE